MTYKNCVVRYTESSDLWTIYSYSSDLRRGMAYNSGSTLTRVVATDMGMVATHNSGVLDIGEPIKYRLRTKWYDWGEVATSKVIEELTALCEKAQAAELMYRVDEDTKWVSIGQLKKFVTFFNKQQIRFNRIRFQVSGVSRFDPPVFLGLEVVKGQNEGITQ